jgi:hypothetical protein
MPNVQSRACGNVAIYGICRQSRPFGNAITCPPARHRLAAFRRSVTDQGSVPSRFGLMDEFWLDGSSITTHFKNAKERGSNSLSGPTHHTQPINTQGHSHKSQRPEHCWCCSGTTIRYVVLSLHRCHRDHRDHRCYSCCFVHRRLAGSTPIIVELRIESNRPRRQNQTLFAPSSRA